MATQVMSRVREMFAVTLGVRALLEAPQLGELARARGCGKGVRHTGKPELKKQPRPARLPLSETLRNGSG